MRLQKSFYLQSDVVDVAKQLIGKLLVSKIGGTVTKGIISETEAYNGIKDKACHAFNNKRTNRTEVMFHEGGKCYLYLCYGVHTLFNIVVSEKDTPNAVLIRSLIPFEGIVFMKERRGLSVNENKLCSGPGNLSKAMGFHYSQSGLSLLENDIFIEDNGIIIEDQHIEVSKRIGVEYAKEHADLPYRFVLKPYFCDQLKKKYSNGPLSDRIS
ncbi:MAG TPA: DNA-3-methyladenine glycosylase [Bacteroidia bacterium]|nr:DNA-3-methyladenine glycosylase [Bacteroidia bacterium]